MTTETPTDALHPPERAAGDGRAGSPGAAPPARVAVVGAGRLGTALARAMGAAGIDVRGPLARGTPPPRGSEAILLCVPDAEIPAAAAAVAGAAPLVGHTSGATGIGALASARAGAFGLHPLQTFTGDDPPERFRGAGCAVAGSTQEALATATALAGRLGMRPFLIADGDRAAYHAAASIASNFLVTLQAAAEDAAGAAGIRPEQARALLAPLVRATVENWAAVGPERALTGPLARGDEATATAQREALAAAVPRLLPLFDALADRTRALAGTAALT